MPRKSEVEFKRTQKLEDGTQAPYQVDVMLYMLASLKKIEKLLKDQTEMLADFLEMEFDDEEDE